MPVKVGIIDNDMSLRIPKEGTVEGDEFWSRYHGNICRSIIQHYADDVEFINKKIFTRSLTAEKRELIKALKNCMLIDVDIINLSLGSTYSKDFKDLREISRMLHRKGIIVIAAISNSNEVTMPAFSINTIGVGCDDRLRESQYYCVDSRLGLFLGNGMHCISSINHKRIVTPAYSSFSAPMIAGIVANMIEKNPSMSFNDIKNKLIKDSLGVYPVISKRIIDDTPQIAVIKDLTFAYAIKEHFERRGFSVYLGTDDNLALDIFEYDLGITDVSTDEVKNDSLYDLIITNDDMRKVLKVVDTKEESVYSEGEKRKLIKKIERLLT